MVISLSEKDGTDCVWQKMSQRKPFAILCGAGISSWAPANLPMAAPLRQNIVEALLERLPIGSLRDTFLTAAGEMPLEEFISAVGWVIEGALERIYSGGQPNAWHRLIAGMMVRGFVNPVFTTNFDVLLTRGLEEHSSGWKDPGDFHTCNMLATYEPPQDESLARPATETIYHIHGTHQAWNMCIAYEHIMNPVRRVRALRPLTEFLSLPGSTLLVVGHRAADPDFVALVRGLSSQADVLYVERRGAGSDGLALPGCFAGLSGAYICVDQYESFVSGLWERIKGTQVPVDSSHNSAEWKSHVHEWADALPDCAAVHIAKRVVARPSQDSSMEPSEAGPGRWIRVGKYNIRVQGDVVRIYTGNNAPKRLSDCHSDRGMLQSQLLPRRMQVLGYTVPDANECEDAPEIPEPLCDPRELELHRYVTALIAGAETGHENRRQFVQTARRVLTSHSALHAWVHVTPR